MTATDTARRSALFEGSLGMSAIAVLTLAAACAGSSVRPAQAPAVGTAPVYLSSMPRSLPQALLDRYACLNERPLMCQCSSRLATKCECHCPL